VTDPTASATPTFADAEDNESDLDLEVNDDKNLDVDVPPDDETEDTESASADASTKETKAAKTPRTPAPEGFVKPVEFAKLLSAHLGKAVPPQVVYSYIKNNVGSNAKHPFPVHEQDGYAWYIKPEEGLAWWDAKNSRVSSSKEAKAAKEAAKAAKAETASTNEAEAAAPVVEAE